MVGPISFTCDIIDDNRNRRISNVGRDQAPEPLLTSCVPKLQSHCFFIIVERLRNEINAYGGLKGFKFSKMIGFYFVIAVEFVMHESVYNRGLSYRLIAQKHELVF